MAKYALLSVSDKTNIASFAKELASLGFSIISTGGTAKTLTDVGVEVTPISDITGNPEAFDGRMKTISFQIEGGILFDRSNPEHVKQAKELKIPNIEIVACNLYPFEQTPSIETIDVGGPTMLRSAAKNYKNVLSISDPEDYERVAEALKSEVSEELRMELAQKTFEHLSFYDAQIAQFFRRKTDNPFSKELTIPGRKVQELRWGDNKHQQASLYVAPGTYSPFTNMKKVLGRDLSGTNITDISVGFEEVRLFDTPAAVVIKHNTPCGIALGDSPAQALKRAIDADSESAFGGTIVLNKEIDLETVQVIASFKESTRTIFDIVAAPGMTQEAEDNIGSIRKSMGVYILGKSEKPSKKDIYYKEVVGGFVAQSSDWDHQSGFDKWQVVTDKKPTKEQMEQMKTAWTMIRRVRSNAVIVVDKKLPQTWGIGTGQTSRFRAAKIALELAGKEHTKDAILASDAFFPFGDSVKIAGEYGIACVVQSGGSVKDQESIDEANKNGIIMVFTGERLFWHY